MSNQPRVAKVLAVLMISMTAGAIVLMLLGNNPPSGGAFCLSSYYRLDSIEKALRSQVAQYPSRWSCVEIYYSDTKAGNIEQLAALAGLISPEDINCHFVVCNGLGGNNGQILSTEKWQRQWSIIPDQRWYGNGQTIRICVIADEKTSPAAEIQRKRVDALLEGLHRKFDIQTSCTHYPSDWN